MKKIVSFLILISLLSVNCFSAGIADFISDDGVIPQNTENVRKTYIVELEQPATKDGVSLFSTEAAVSAKKSEIESALPDAEGGFVYTTVMQGFSITAGSDDYEKILNTPGVKNVHEAQTLEIIYPVTTSELSGGSGTASPTSYTGAGEVIAIIDSEFNTAHDYFSHTPVSPALSRDDISTAAGSLSIDIDADLAYVSPKIPFAYDYGDGDYDTRYDDLFHGTHVAGIAAGKNGPVLNGENLNGIAPDAQLLLMKVSDSESDIDMDSALAAIDDAVKLGASVINISFGTAYASASSNYLLNLAITNARDAGVAVCAAAGNEGIVYKTTQGTVTPVPENIDYGPISTPSSFSATTAVASADTVGSVKQYITLAGGSRVECSYAYTEGRIDLLPANTEYVYCGLAKAADFTGIDVTGKIVLADKGSIAYSVKAENAADAGAVGIIIAGTNSTAFVTTELVLPSATVKKAGGDILKAAENKTIVSFTSEQTALTAPAISSYSSSGTAENLELKPDLTAPGRRIYSSDCDGGYTTNSGTSMASPDTSGSFAVMYQYLKDSGFEYTAETKVTLAENLMMSTADVIRKNGVPVSVRKQGAGLINLQKATTANVILAGSDGKSKLSLKDKLSDTFEISFNAVNLSDTAVTFSSPCIELCTDGVSGENISAESVSIPVKSHTMPETVTVPANSTYPISFTVTMDSEFTAENLQTFTNGFYIDGFVYLSDDLHIPFMGFYGNWAAASVFDRSVYDEGGSLLRIKNTGGTFLYSNAVVSGNTYSFYLGENAKTEKFEKNLIAISPNSDNYLDGLGLSLHNMRTAKKLSFRLRNSAGRAYSLGSYNNLLDKFSPLSLYFKIPSTYPDGDYTFEITGILNYDGAEDSPSLLTIPVKIDRTAPEILSASLNSDCTKLTVTGSDNHYVQTFGLSYKDMDGTAHTLTKNPDALSGIVSAEFSLENPDLSTISIGCFDYAYNYSEAEYTEDIYINSSISGNIVSYSAVNNTDAILPTQVYAGFYNDSHKLIAPVISTGSSGSFEVSDDILSESSYYKIFLWDEKLMPYAKSPIFPVK